MRKKGLIITVAAATTACGLAWLGLRSVRSDDTFPDVATIRFGNPGEFARWIQPIFDSRCLGCHGGVSPKSRLELTSHAGVMRGGKNGVVIVPGSPETSELILRVTRKPEEKGFMPDGKPALDARQVALIREWVRQGAPQSR